MSAVIGFVKDLTGHPAGIEKDFKYAWLESPLGKARLTLIADNWNDVKRWPSGRLFGGRGEYRWQCLEDGRLHKVLLLEDPPLPDHFQGRLDLKNIEEDKKDDHLVLWGEWIDPKKDPESNPNGEPIFYANEIPQVLAYPLDFKSRPEENETPRLIIRRYRDIAGKEGEFVRCVWVTMKAEDEEE